MDPIVKFSDIEGFEPPEGITPELLESPAIQNVIKSAFDVSFTNRFEVEASGLKKTSEQIKQEKEALKTKLEEVTEKYKDMDPEEVARLRELVKNNGDATKQLEVLTAERDGIKTSFENQIAEKDKAYNDLQSELHVERLTNHVANGVREHNAKYPQVHVEPGAERWIIEEAKNVWRYDAEQSRFVPMDGDRVLTGSSGAVMEYAEWVNTLREKPEFAPLFTKPTGGGAGGSSVGAGGKHFNPKDMGGSAEERKAAIAAKTGLPIS